MSGKRYLKEGETVECAAIFTITYGGHSLEYAHMDDTGEITQGYEQVVEQDDEGFYVIDEDLDDLEDV